MDVQKESREEENGQWWICVGGYVVGVESGGEGSSPQKSLGGHYLNDLKIS